MLKSKSTDYYGSFTDDDSGVGLDYASSNDMNSSTLTLIESASSSNNSHLRISSPLPHPTTTTTIKKRSDATPLIKFTSDGIVERIRPITMRNSENGDYVLCHTKRGTYVAYRTPVVPQWVTRLVDEIERQQR